MWQIIIIIIEGLVVIELPATNLTSPPTCLPKLLQYWLYSLFLVSHFWKENWTFQNPFYIHIMRNSNLSMLKCWLPVEFTAARCPFSSVFEDFAALHLQGASCILEIWDWGPVHVRSQVPSPKSREVNQCNLNRWEHGSWDLPLHTGLQVPSSRYDMDVCMAPRFGGEAWDLCWELGRAKS